MDPNREQVVYWSDILNLYILWNKRLNKTSPPQSNKTLMGCKMDAFAYNKRGYALIYLKIFNPFYCRRKLNCMRGSFKSPQRCSLQAAASLLKNSFIHCPAAPGSQLSCWRLSWPSGHLRGTSSAGAWWCFSRPAWSPYRWAWWASPGVKTQNAQCHAVQKQMCRVFHFCRPNPSSSQNSHLKVKRKRKKK